ncbi:hypothetical protein [Arthrobacter sp. UM1]|uniref:hypothetical protein n=1 Tax=Arthrobacter sp. UM1 TaxID=2766776 RepID=UPI001CF6E918|nr:hypothetical protein [Arthrobacter sp. UM1]MCB4208916.1 hypothetical protein [Arthrobacter sp. UM1]
MGKKLNDLDASSAELQRRAELKRKLQARNPEVRTVLRVRHEARLKTIEHWRAVFVSFLALLLGAYIGFADRSGGWRRLGLMLLFILMTLLSLGSAIVAQKRIEYSVRVLDVIKEVDEVQQRTT